MQTHSQRITVCGLFVLAATGICGPTALADDNAPRIGYQPPGIVRRAPPLDFLVYLDDVALDANIAQGNPYFRTPDATNVNHLWEVRPCGDYVLLVPRVGQGQFALDANGGRNQPYFRELDVTNDNQLWKLTKGSSGTVIEPKVGEGRLALSTNRDTGRTRFSERDRNGAPDCVWELRPEGESYLLLPTSQVPHPTRPTLDVTAQLEQIIDESIQSGSNRAEAIIAIESAIETLKGR